MKYKILTLIMALAMVGCNDYLDLVPEDDVQSLESIFEQRSGVEKFHKTAHQAIFQTDGNSAITPAMLGADEFMTSHYLRTGTKTIVIHGLSIAEGKQNLYQPFYNIWGRSSSNDDTQHDDRYLHISHCNTFLEHIDGVHNMTDDEKNQWIAEIKVLKAYYYFELLRQYGPIVLMPKTISVKEDVEKMQLPRSPIDSCVKAIVDLCDQAIPNLKHLNEKQVSRIQSFNKQAAYFLKAKTLLFAASPLFNGNDQYTGFTNRDGVTLFNPSYDKEKWHKAAIAADEAVESAESIGRGLESGESSKSTQLRNTMKDIHNSTLNYDFSGKEWLWLVSTINSGDQTRKWPLFDKSHYAYTEFAKGSTNPTINIAEQFYTENGLPIDMDATWNNSAKYQIGTEINTKYKDVVKLEADVLNFHIKREPRFYADIAFDNGYWELKENRYVLMEAYKGKSAGIQQDRESQIEFQNLTGYWCKKMLPVAEYGANGKKIPFAVFRLAELYTMQAEAWNEYLETPDSRVYDPLNKVRERAGIPTVQDSWNNFSTNSGYYQEKNGMRNIIRQEINIEFAFEGHRFWNLRRWKTANIEMNKPLKGWKVFGTSTNTFFNENQGPVNVFNQNKFTAPRDNFWPIGSEQVITARINQNLGW